MIETILPPAVASAYTFVDTVDAVLYPEEAAGIDRAVPQRRAEFATARACARRALAALGTDPVPIAIGTTRSPWPDGIVESIAHCAGFRAAAVAQQTSYRSIGIDAEPQEPIPRGTLERVSLRIEREQLGRPADVHLDRVLFSAKESVYKAWFPMTGWWLGFDDAIVTLHVRGTFEARLLVHGPVARFDDRWLARDGLVMTAIATPVRE